MKLSGCINNYRHCYNLSLDFGFFTMYPTVIDKQYFGNFQFLDESGNISKKNKDYLFFKYLLTNENKVLSVSFMDSDLVNKSIKDGELVGVVSVKDVPEESNSKSETIRVEPMITDSSENIINFIKSKDLENLFTDIMTFRKVN
ncbi:MAG: hypothetical protein HUK40_14940 [Desulfobacter sp.]|nr:hypothetical protein [Desulfobacter sp.]